MSVVKTDKDNKVRKYLKDFMDAFNVGIGTFSNAVCKDWDELSYGNCHYTLFWSPSYRSEVHGKDMHYQSRDYQ